MGADGSLRIRHGSMREHFIHALERRAGGLQGSARKVVEARLSELTAAAPERRNASEGTPPARTALRELLDTFAARSVAIGKGAPDTLSATMLDEARQLWDTLRTESRGREALADEPTDAGPLNSARLVHRSLHLMREVSPGYLRHFLAYADALSWLEEFDAAGPKPKPASKPKTSRKAR